MSERPNPKEKNFLLHPSVSPGMFVLGIKAVAKEMGFEGKAIQSHPSEKPPVSPEAVDDYCTTILAEAPFRKTTKIEKIPGGTLAQGYTYLLQHPTRGSYLVEFGKAEYYYYSRIINIPDSLPVSEFEKALEQPGHVGDVHLVYTCEQHWKTNTLRVDSKGALEIVKHDPEVALRGSSVKLFGEDEFAEKVAGFFPTASEEFYMKPELKKISELTVEITEQGKQRLEDLYASLSPKEAKAFKALEEKLGPAVDRFVAMSDSELMELIVQTQRETEQISPES